MAILNGQEIDLKSLLKSEQLGKAMLDNSPKGDGHGVCLELTEAEFSLLKKESDDRICSYLSKILTSSMREQRSDRSLSGYSAHFHHNTFKTM